MKIDFDRGLIPAIVQDDQTGKVLMLGYMNRIAYEKTLETGKVTFFSRSRQQLWTKGETSGNFLLSKEILIDCDGDTLLVKANPAGPICHTGADTCFKEINRDSRVFLFVLEKIIADRKANPKPGSYTNKLFDAGINRIAQKIGEEATEVVIDAVSDNVPGMKKEVADLLYHLLVLLAEKDVSVAEVLDILTSRHK
ncbi:bifunctional phosphoribosyl-AMP cyclohydrolase/phosphoribosyl-ATP diphosphatase HisIE [bacterium]|nr:bifunctional phosphoribosyl-AMP cyclohydrolase/phosphoribosyl-ATP diphosphatase HisIE [bacterium]MBU1064534.1 bifunctional phosphoribosyl-AMP cyclohydrolase/phosphoribosyl-ATP diphosphatase HisIE [bacterium]MBU1633428.1 bifunctional phosphoribosyl-AMP cyclohydrolase/phosphoribosyl-ATP diphosphatase HisIE [bacterium]MBU1873358.1 bifunctional phosphoribosyl-AMP cyclohydrolase/phosphoribosyl-ATP diphosphatase HisIE [bacterium]